MIRSREMKLRNRAEIITSRTKPVRRKSIQTERLKKIIHENEVEDKAEAPTLTPHERYH
jgi:hypothetical protein